MNMRWSIVLAVFYGGCLGDCAGTADSGEFCGGDPTLQFVSYTSFGEAAWDGLEFELEAGSCGEAKLSGEEEFSLLSGGASEFALVPLDGCARRYVGATELTPGSYDTLVVHDVDHGQGGVRDVSLPLRPSHVVSSVARDHDFDKEALVGKAFRLEIGSEKACAEAAELLTEFVPLDPWLEITSVENGQATFRMIERLDQPELPACVYLEDRADLSETGELTWQRESLPLSTEPAIQAWDLAMRLGFDAAGEQVAGLELGATIDVVNLEMDDDDAPDTAPPPTWEDSCELLASWGMPCEPCPESGVESCVDVQFFAARASQDEFPYDGTELPDCDVALDIPYLGCGWSCSATSRQRTPLVLLGLLGLLQVWRRRRVLS